MREKNQVVLPLKLGICIPEGDFVFKVAEICENLDYTELFKTYLRSWRKVNPITMFEILVFAYMNRKFSSRAIEEACITDIRFMWLLNGEPAPSDSTITRFQRGHLAEAIEGLFYQFVNKLHEIGEIKFKNLFVDGTKTEAYANKYTFVWKSVVEKNHLGKFGNRNSFSKTDTDATFMHMKEDHMKNGQLKPGYNIQIGVESEYIVGVGSFSNRNDVGTLVPFLNRIRKHTNRKFENIIADAGYESSENYLYLEENGQNCFIKPQNYEISKKKKLQS